MKAAYNVRGTERKALVKTIETITKVTPEYLGVPTCGYKIGIFTVDKEGTVCCEDEIKGVHLIDALAGAGYKTVSMDKPIPAADGFSISLPKEGFSDDAIENLKRLVNGKASLIQKALRTENLTVTVTEDEITFPWWRRQPDADCSMAYAAFIGKLGAMAKEAKHVTVKDRQEENEKYAFRCFLLRLGFIGPEYKENRKVLLQNLSGSSAFKGGKDD
jgi:hypothetical protein